MKIWVPLLTSIAVAAITVGCMIGPGTSSSSSAGGGGGGGSSSCDHRNDCASCAYCALNGPCASLLATCQNNAACAGIDQCIAGCGPGPDCRDTCYAANPGGTSDYDAVSQCLYCQQCPSDCPGVITCP